MDERTRRAYKQSRKRSGAYSPSAYALYVIFHGKKIRIDNYSIKLRQRALCIGNWHNIHWESAIPQGGLGDADWIWQRGRLSSFIWQGREKRLQADVVWLISIQIYIARAHEAKIAARAKADADAKAKAEAVA